MANLQDIIKLSQADGGKFYVLNEQGEIQLVILPVEEYQRLLENKLVSAIAAAGEDVDAVNREIVTAQLQEQEALIPAAEAPRPAATPRVQSRYVDLREEVIDPSFDFEGPKVEVEDL